MDSAGDFSWDGDRDVIALDLDREKVRRPILSGDRAGPATFHDARVFRGSYAMPGERVLIFGAAEDFAPAQTLCGSRTRRRANSS